MKSSGSKILDFLSGFGFAIILLSFLLLLTFLGTIEQTNAGLYDVQKRYFESLVVMHGIGPISVPLPGVYLLLVLLAVNLLLGGLVRVRKDVNTAGVLIIHVGIVVLLGGSFVEHRVSNKGHTTLLEGMQSDEFKSHHEWEIAIAEGDAKGEVTEHVIPGDQWLGLEDADKAVFRSADLPFELEVHQALKNCEVERSPAAPGAVDGYVLKPMAPEKQNERNVAGAIVTVVDKATGERTDGLLWAWSRYPFSVVSGGKRWTIDLSKRRWPLPFTVELKDFRHVLHPGTGMAKSYESDVIKHQDGVSEEILISMNEPLRQQGYTLFQSGFGEPRPGTGGRYSSTFAVVQNPADQIPLVACIIMTIGLVLHFGRKLLRFVRSQARSTS